MGHRNVICPKCSKHMRSDHLKRHLRVHEKHLYRTQNKPLDSSRNPKKPWILEERFPKEQSIEIPNTTREDDQENDIPVELRGQFLSPEKSIAWRKMYTEGADLNQVLKEVQDKVANKIPQADIPLKHRVKSNRKVVSHKISSIPIIEQQYPSIENPRISTPIKEQQLGVNHAVPRDIPIKIEEQRCSRRKFKMRRPIYCGGGKSYCRMKRYGQKL